MRCSPLVPSPPPGAAGPAFSSATWSSRPALRAIRNHFACLIGYGATAVYPYLAYQTLYDMMRKGGVKIEHAERAAAGQELPQGQSAKGLFKIMSKMGISTVASYRGGQLFEIVGPVRRHRGLVFPRHHQPHRGRDLRRPAAGHRVHRAARLEQHAFHRAGRPCSSSCTVASTTCTTQT